MVDCKPVSTSVDTQVKVYDAFGPLVADLTRVMGLTGALQYMAFTRPDIGYTVQQICLHMHDPREPHLTVIKHILRYL
jgi:hypothetical protein